MKHRQPAIFIPHGGGPWPFVDVGFMHPHEGKELSAFLQEWPKKLSMKPEAIIVVSAHWEEKKITLMTSSNPEMYYDYYGFPEESYHIKWPAPGSPQLAEKISNLLNGAGIETAYDEKRGFDHGTFVPLKVMFPNAEIPTIQISLKKGLNPEEHFRIGQTLSPLREQNILIIGSGMSFHNLREFGSPKAAVKSEIFDKWLSDAATKTESKLRKQLLINWESAPEARYVHPREEHLIPLFVIAGAGENEIASNIFSGTFADMKISAYQYGNP